MKKIISIKNLSLTAGNFELGPINLTVDENEYFVLMGETGSGKTLLLKALCGLQAIYSGTINIGNKNITPLVPRKREIGYIPQRSALFPHLNVIKNIIFPLKFAGVSRHEAITKAEKIVELLGIKKLLERNISNLSGGERQKVALARTLIMKPNLLLFDEPVSAVDEPTRREICSDILKIKNEYKIATIHICHSKDEAKCMADKVGIMHNGKIIKMGTLNELEKISDNDIVCRLLK